MQARRTKWGSKKPAMLLTVLSALLMPLSEADADIIDDLPAGHWLEIPNSSLATVFPKNPPSIMSPWGGGVWDSSRERLIIWGGGHADSSHNGVWAFRLTTLAWENVVVPSDNPINGPVYPDGSPSSVHTYGGIVYLPPPRDALWGSGGSIWSSGNCEGRTWLYPLAASPALNGWQPVEDYKGGCNMRSIYDSNTDTVWYAPGGGTLFQFDPDNLDTPWTERYKSDSQPSGNSVAAYHPRLGLMVVVGGGWDTEPGTWIYDISDPDAVTFEKLPTVGDNEIEKAKAPGVVYDSESDAIVAWAGQDAYREGSDGFDFEASNPDVYDTGISRDDVYVLDIEATPPSWERRVPADENTVSPKRTTFTQGYSDKIFEYYNGTWSRFQYVPSRNVFILSSGWNAENQNLFIYRLSSAVGVPPDPLPPESTGTDSTAGGNSGGDSMGGEAPSRGGSSETSADGTGDSGSGTAGSADDAGCSCRAESRPSPRRGWWLLAFGAILLVRRRQ